jgi:hypothetical protein
VSREKIQAFAVSTDFPKLLNAAYTVTVAELQYDLGYEAAFQEVPIGPNEDSWDIYNVTNGITFNLIPEGGRIKIDKMSGAIQTAHTDYYGGAIGWTHKLITKRKIAAMMQIATMFRNNYFQNKASNMYLLLAAGVAAAVALYGVTAYQGAATLSQLQRDILTINRAVYTLSARCKDKGYGNTAQIPLVGYAHLLDQDRIAAAMTATAATQQVNGQVGQTVKRQISWIFTLDSNLTSGSPFIVIPKNQTQYANPMAPTSFTAPIDILTLNTMQSVWAEYGAAIGDVDVFQQFTLG